MAEPGLNHLGIQVGGDQRRGISAVIWVARQVPAERGERGPQDLPGVPGPGDRYPGTEEVMIDPVGGAIRHRLVDGVEELTVQVAVGEVNRFGAFPSRSGNLRKMNRRHIGMVPPGRRPASRPRPGQLRSARTTRSGPAAAKGVFTVRASSTRREYEPAYIGSRGLDDTN